MAPCGAVMVTFPRPLDLGWDAAFVSESPLSWVARNGSKPDRPNRESWVLHASSEWSRRNLEADPEGVADRLIAAFRDVSGGHAVRHAHRDVHRWRYSQPVEPLADACLIDRHLGIAACGDWCGGPRVEGAFTSGRAAAESLQAVVGGAL